MAYKPGDVCIHTGFNTEKLRYWRDVLDPLKDKKGNCRCYTNNDVVALLAVDSVVLDLNAQIGGIKTLANQIIRFCQQEPNWKQLAHYMLLVFPARKEVQMIRTEDFELPLGRGNFLSIFLSDHVNHLLSSITGDQGRDDTSQLLKERRKRVTAKRRAQFRRT